MNSLARFAKTFSRVRYSASDALPDLLRQLAESEEHRVPGSNLRLIAADAHEDLGDLVSAEQLRSNMPLHGYTHTNGQNLYVRWPSGTSYYLGTHPDLISALEKARSSRHRVLIRPGDPKTGKDWLYDFETRGTISRTVGPISQPLIVATTRSMGGGPVSGHVVKVVDLDTKQTLYQHPQYHTGEIKVVDNADGSSHPVEVLRDGEVVAGFSDSVRASRYLKRLGVSPSK
jgi:hypothetical protein